MHKQNTLDSDNEHNSLTEYEATLQVLNVSEIKSIATDKGIKLKNKSKKPKSKQKLIQEILSIEND